MVEMDRRRGGEAVESEERVEGREKT